MKLRLGISSYLRDKKDAAQICFRGFEKSEQDCLKRLLKYQLMQRALGLDLAEVSGKYASKNSVCG